MKTSSKPTSALAVVTAMALASAAFADDPVPFIKTPGYDPAFYSTNTCSIVASAASSLKTGTLSLPAATPSAVEARYRTWLESPGTRLRSTKFRQTLIAIY